MTVPCNNCGLEIDFKLKKDGTGKYPINLNGSFHNCRGKGQETPEKKILPQGIGWTNVKQVKEIPFEEVASHLLSGWVILDRVERMEFVSKTFDAFPGVSTRTETGNITKSVYIVGVREGVTLK